MFLKNRARKNQFFSKRPSSKIDALLSVYSPNSTEREREERRLQLKGYGGNRNWFVAVAGIEALACCATMALLLCPVVGLANTVGGLYSGAGKRGGMKGAEIGWPDKNGIGPMAAPVGTPSMAGKPPL